MNEEEKKEKITKQQINSRLREIMAQLGDYYVHRDNTDLINAIAQFDKLINRITREIEDE